MSQTSRRHIMFGAGAAIAGGVLAACGSEVGGGGAPAPAAGAGGTAGGAAGTVNWLVRSGKEENGGQEKVFEPMLKEKLPKVKVERIVVPQDQYIPKINSMAAANESLELWGFGGNYYDYWWRKLPQDLTSYITADKWDVNTYFHAGLMDRFKINGKYYGVSQLSTFGSVLLYNKDLLDKAGLKAPPVDWNDASWTMDKALEYATKLTKDPGSPNGTFGMSLDLWAKMTSLPYLWGGDSWTKEHYTDFIAPKSNFNSEAVLQSHTFLQDLIYKHKVAPTPEEETALGDQLALIQSGKVAMRFGNPGDNSAYKPTGMPYDVGVFPLGPSGTKRGVGGGGTGWAIAGPTKQPEEAWAFLQLITSKEAQLGEVGIGQTTPSRTSVATSQEYLAGPPKGTKAFGDGQDYVVRDPVHAKWPDAQRDAVTKILNEQLWTGKTPAAQVAKDVKERGDAMLKG